MSPGRGEGPYGPASSSQVDEQMKTDVINMRTDIGELKDQMKLRSPESLVSTIGTVVSTAVAAAMADENAPAPVWAKSLTDSVATLTQKHETLNSAQKTLQATVAKLERELEALAAVGQAPYSPHYAIVKLWQAHQARDRALLQDACEQTPRHHAPVNRRARGPYEAHLQDHS